jgi:two-component system phosphate regulon sensor histidine kinase PhoR
MQRRIRWRITLPYLIVLIVTVTVLTSMSISHIREQETSRWQEQLVDTARFLAIEAKDGYPPQQGSLILADLVKSSSDSLEVDVTFLSQDGQIITSSLQSDELPASPLTLPGVTAALQSGTGVTKTQNVLGAAAQVLDDSGQPIGLVQVQKPLSAIQMNLDRLTSLTLASVSVGAAAVILLIFFVHESSYKPVESLSIAAQQMRMGNFTNLDFPESSFELEKLSEALKAMAAQLGAQIDALTGERAKLSAVLNQMTDGVMIVDADGRVQLLNPAAERIFQIKESAGMGRSIVEVIRYHQLVELWRKSKGGERESMTLEIGPQHLFLQVLVIPLKTALPGNSMILFQDLTQLRRLETVRRDFISNVSHELRTPLASLKALAETLQEGALEDPPAARRFILRMETEIDNLTQLVNELLELSRIESGKVPLSFHRIKPVELLTPAYERMALQAERAGLDLNLDCPENLPAVFADPDRITQVLINLIHNAVKFTPPGGKLTVSAYQDRDQIVFFVRDTGVGIAKKDLARIFERFYKADRARAGGGTGLGLSIARHMIESHGGSIWAESEEQVGSTFYFSLPVA